MQETCKLLSWSFSLQLFECWSRLVHKVCKPNRGLLTFVSFTQHFSSTESSSCLLVLGLFARRFWQGLNGSKMEMSIWCKKPIKTHFKISTGRARPVFDSLLYNCPEKSGAIMRRTRCWVEQIPLMSGGKSQLINWEGSGIWSDSRRTVEML
jgi:hypothetical protein